MTKEIYLNGLNCASCAMKIERRIKKLDGVSEAAIDLANSKALIKISKAEKTDDIFQKTKEIVLQLEPHVKVSLTKASDEVAVAGNSGVSLLTAMPMEHAGEGSHSHGEETEKPESKWLSIVKDIAANKKYQRIGLGILMFVFAVLDIFASNVTLALFVGAYALIGGDVIKKSFNNIKMGEIFDENFLMTIATFGAFMIGEYAEGVAVMLFYQVGEAFQDYAVNNSRKSIKALLNIKPQFANLKVFGQVTKVKPETVKVGDIIMIKPGEKVPLDGVVISGKSMVNTSDLTGESVPRSVAVGDEIFGGFLNESGMIEVEVAKEYKNSTIAKMLDLVENASSKKSKTEKFITKFARYYTPVVVLLAALITIVPPIVIGGGFAIWFERALIFLVVSCPCALVVSIPLGFFGGIGASSKEGILVKGGNYLEALNDVDTVIFDKTGTLTKGSFEVVDMSIADGYDESALLKYAAHGEAHSNHPIAKSIIDKFEGNIDHQLVSAYEEVSGKGIQSMYDGRSLLVGSHKLMAVNNIEFVEETQTGTSVYVAYDGNFVGSLLIADEIRESAPKLISDLKKLGISKTVMLTGDNKNIAASVSKSIGVDEVHSELLPHEKVARMEAIKHGLADGKKAAFIGDGINDAPVLAMSDIGIAMGALGSDVAVEAADVVLMVDDPYKVVDALKISKRTKKIVYQNIVLAFSVKFIVLAMGAVGMATMWEAVFADVGVALIAVLNATRVAKN